ncbi:hypothetical protein GH714_008406 [Hevea brasiliensis]|uniref:Aminotransferase-like plant mobile domain-containing protein n=1 Tax=Hevea brasiliensis TaxID=3981 RepID=A0A6A6KM96_HEVBR|nr:hypothetical protein GH714_008406 [Hevea brasiliensis]
MESNDQFNNIDSQLMNDGSTMMNNDLCEPYGPINLGNTSDYGCTTLNDYQDRDFTQFGSFSQVQCPLPINVYNSEGAGPNEPIIRLSGFFGIATIGFIEVDHALITALIKRWRLETHTLHLTVGEATLTLQDVEIITGLPIDGTTITGDIDYD